MKCPNCDVSLGVDLNHFGQESITLALTWEGDFVSARTVGGMIENTRKLFEVCAKDAGLKVDLMMHSIEWKPKRAEFHFLIVPRKPKAA